MSQTGVVQSLVYLQQLDQRILGLASQELLADVAQIVALLVILEVIRRCHATTLQVWADQQLRASKAAAGDGSAGCSATRHSWAVVILCIRRSPQHGARGDLHALLMLCPTTNCKPVDVLST